jgi:hypothetical protein
VDFFDSITWPKLVGIGIIAAILIGIYRALPKWLLIVVVIVILMIAGAVKFG